MTELRIALRGAPDALARALDVCLIRYDVTAVVERAGEVELSVVADSFDATFDGVEVEELPVPESMPTGLEDDRAILVGDAILVRPPWVAQPPDFVGTTIVVPRGGAFGSGEHGSTQAALLAMDAVWTSGIESFADVGCGSGVLAAYAAARGVATIHACDIDEPSVRATRELLPAAHVCVGGAEALGARVDAVVANLAGHELAAALDSVLAVWNGCGPLVLSGMRPHEVEAIEHRVPGDPAERVQRDEFVALAYASGV